MLRPPIAPVDCGRPDLPFVAEPRSCCDGPYGLAVLAVLLVGLVGAILFCGLSWLSGCVAAQQTRAEQRIEPLASQPAPQPGFDAQQLAGQIVAGVQARLESTIETRLDSRIEATGIRTEYGFGAVVSVCGVAALSLGAFLLSNYRQSKTLTAIIERVLDLSNERELKRIEMRKPNGQNPTW